MEPLIQPPHISSGQKVRAISPSEALLEFGGLIFWQLISNPIFLEN